MSLDFITEPARHVPVIRRTDVLVVGSGPRWALQRRNGRRAGGGRGYHGRTLWLLWW